MNKPLKIIIWILGLITIFAIDYLIAITTGFIGHAGLIEIAYIIGTIYVIDKEAKKEVKE